MTTDLEKRIDDLEADVEYMSNLLQRLAKAMAGYSDKVTEALETLDERCATVEGRIAMRLPDA